MGSKTRLSSYCTKRANNGVNLATSRKIITRLARPIAGRHMLKIVKCEAHVLASSLKCGLTNADELVRINI